MDPRRRARDGGLSARGSAGMLLRAPESWSGAVTMPKTVPMSPSRVGVLLSCLLALGGVAAGCGGKTSSTATRPASSFVGHARDAVVFIQLRRTGNSLSGTLQEAILKHAEG